MCKRPTASGWEGGTECDLEPDERSLKLLRAGRGSSPPYHSRWTGANNMDVSL